MGAEAPLPTEFNVKLQEPEVVTPEVAIESQSYFLTNLDQNIASIVQTVYLFDAKSEKAGEDPAQTIKEALRKALVHYYPLAGRLAISPEGKLHVDYSGQGVIFVAAESDAALSAVGDVSKEDSGRLGKLVYQVPGARHLLEMPLVTAQVTKFACGGFVLGLAMNHCLFDGIGAMEFVNSWGEIARGLPLSTPPVIDRSFLKARNPPKIECAHNEFVQIDDDTEDQTSPEGIGAVGKDIIFKTYPFSSDALEKLKKLAMEGGELQRCSSFQALVAYVWRARCQALMASPEQKFKLLFAVDIRSRVEPPLPKGYMGNAMVFAHLLETAEELKKLSFPALVKKVQDAIADVTDKFVKSVIDYIEATRARPTLAGTLLVSSWSRLAFYVTDFGWGEPTQSGSVTLPEKEVAFFRSQGKDQKSIDVVLGLPARAMEIFDQLVQPVL
ncbi:hypothetical protein KP509_05G085100 [Ceratopteris richardii]|uniref:Omega-hydroxypalmitate O-feruloyl transferase n=1 Tax=Ceratopteris richardii TaxID=49495 RepID=A0A8T2V0D2_CERRI|nr:hypothetical protein KP509_05G085100 [Ceratopteris richardii]